MSEMQKHPNPVLWADFPDPDVIRVGDTYYMASTTMHMFPGGDILRSHNLCDWELACHVFETLDGTPAQRLKAGNIYGQGMWAPSLRYAGGLFHLVFSCNDTHRSCHFTAERAEGPWTRRPMTGFYHDPSVLFDDDGRVYIAYGNREIRLTELAPDLSEPLAGGLDRIIVRDLPAAEMPLGYEGSHLQKIGGRYVLSLIHWPRSGAGCRTQAVFTAERPEGPWTGGDVLADDMGCRSQGVAQGGFVQSPDGTWYAMLFQDHGAVGRIPALVPVRWEGERPVLGPVPHEIATEDLRPGSVCAPLTDSDDFSAETLKGCWQWNHEPAPELVSLAPGRLSLRTGCIVPGLEQAANTLTQRTWGPACSAEVTVDASGLLGGDYAGLCALQGEYAQLAVCRQEGQLFLCLLTRRDGETREMAWTPLEGKTVRLRADFDFRDQRDTVSFRWRAADGSGEWHGLGQPHLLHYRLDHFMGVRAGLFCYATKKAGGEAVFSDFTFTREA